MTRPLVSVILVTHGAWPWTRRALTAIAAHTDVDHEIIVVDNASPDGTAENIRDGFPHVRLLTNPTNAGFGAANNQGAQLADGDVLALVNTDAIVPPGWVTPLLHELERAGVGAVVPALLNGDGTLQAAGAVVGPDGSATNVGAGADCDDPAFSFSRAIDYGAAACMLVGREVFLEVGGFDRAFDPAYFEDVDLCLRLAQRGLRTMFVPDVRVPHEGFASGGKDAAVALFHRNRPVFAERWGTVLARDHPPTLWPVHEARTLAARDSRATGRVVIVELVVPAPDGPAGRGVAQALEVSPWLRVTLVGARGSADPWLRCGVEVIDAHDPVTVLAERAGHYDIVVAGEGLGACIAAHQPQALRLADPAALAPAVARLGLL